MIGMAENTHAKYLPFNSSKILSHHEVNQSPVIFQHIRVWILSRPLAVLVPFLQSSAKVLANDIFNLHHTAFLA